MKRSFMNRSHVLALLTVAGVYAGLVGCASAGDVEPNWANFDTTTGVLQGVPSQSDLADRLFDHRQ